MKSLLYLVKTEPVLLTSVVQAVLALIVGLGAALTSGQTGAILPVTTTVLALIAVAAIRPFQMSALTGLVSARGGVADRVRVHNVQLGSVFTLNAAIVAVVAVIAGLHVSPVATLNASTKPKRHRSSRKTPLPVMRRGTASAWVGAQIGQLMRAASSLRHAPNAAHSGGTVRVALCHD